MRPHLIFCVLRVHLCTENQEIYHDLQQHSEARQHGAHRRCHGGAQGKWNKPVCWGGGQHLQRPLRAVCCAEFSRPLRPAGANQSLSASSHLECGLTHQGPRTGPLNATDHHIWLVAIVLWPVSSCNCCLTPEHPNIVYIRNSLRTEFTCIQII